MNLPSARRALRAVGKIGSAVARLIVQVRCGVGGIAGDIACLLFGVAKGAREIGIGGSGLGHRRLRTVGSSGITRTEDKSSTGEKVVIAASALTGAQGHPRLRGLNTTKWDKAKFTTKLASTASALASQTGNSSSCAAAIKVAVSAINPAMLATTKTMSWPTNTRRARIQRQR